MQNASLNLLNNKQKYLDTSEVVGTVLMDLGKEYDCKTWGLWFYQHCYSLNYWLCHKLCDVWTYFYNRFHLQPQFHRWYINIPKYVIWNSIFTKWRCIIWYQVIFYIYFYRINNQIHYWANLEKESQKELRPICWNRLSEDYW